MDIKILKCDDMVNTGSAVLKVIQNNEMPLLDLLVREIIQNSLDAKEKDKAYVVENVLTGEFDYRELNKHFNLISEELDKRYEENMKYICFKDSNTTGLTGPTTAKDVKDGKWGKFLSLVTNIGKAQEEEGAGGCWGYGKTVYYRLGIGLVIFYSRIKEDGQYKSRLKACLVENEKMDNNILPQVNNLPKSGIAWWGIERDGDLYPIENEDDIDRILNCFNIDKYKDDETGTTVIIPYINEKDLLNETYVEENEIPWWCGSLNDYIKVSIQRWYSTRLMNVDYKENPWLKLYINGELFDLDRDLLPLFEIIKELYNFNTLLTCDKYEVFRKEIILRSPYLSSQYVGALLYVKINDEKLNMLPPNNQPSPYVQINNNMNEANYNHNIIAFCRKPGMILRYDIDGRWTNGLNNLDENEYVIALFVPNSENIISVNGRKFTLEEYLRKSEKADHENWTDIMQYDTKDGYRIDTSNFKFVEKIQNSIKRKLVDETKKEEEKKLFGVGSKLSRQFTELFMPKKGFGKKPSPKPPIDPKGDGETPPRTRISKIELKNLEVTEEDYLKKKFILSITNTDKNLSFVFKVDTEDGLKSANKWEEDFKFPVEIKYIYIDSIFFKDGNIVKYQKTLSSEPNNYFEYKELYTERNHIFYGFDISILDINIDRIEGEIIYDFDDTRNRTVITRRKGEDDE